MLSQSWARASDAEQEAQARANENGAPVAVVYNPQTKFHYLVEDPDELETWHPSHVVSVIEPNRSIRPKGRR